jgi:hypothetical protein
MADYKLYLVDQAGRFYRSFDLECDDDAQAIALALKREKGAPKELWRGARVVQRFGQPEPIDLPPSASSGAAGASQQSSAASP